MKKLICKIGIGLILCAAASYFLIPKGMNMYNMYTADKYYDLGKVALESNQYDEAAEYFEKVLNYNNERKKDVDLKLKDIEDEKETRDKFNEAEELYKNKEYIEAMNIYEQISDKAKGYYEIAQGKVIICRNIYINDNINKAKTEAEGSRYDSAITYLDNILKLDSTYEDAVILRGQYSREIKRLAEEAKEAEKKQDIASNSTGQNQNINQRSLLDLP